MASGVKQIGNRTTYERQPTGTLKLYVDGSSEATETFSGVWEKRLENLPVALQPHPDYPTLRLCEFIGAKEPGNIYRYECVYKGILPKTDVWALMQEEVTLMSSQEPLETFYKFSYPYTSPPVTNTLLANIQSALDANVPDITAVYPAITSSTPAWQLWNLRRRGIDSVKVPQMSVKLSYVADPYSEGWLTEVFLLLSRYVGVIAKSDYEDSVAINRARTVPRPIQFEGADGTGGDFPRDYLFNGITWRLQGGLLSVSEDYLLSGPSGWNPYLYDAEYKSPTTP